MVEDRRNALSRRRTYPWSDLHGGYSPQRTPTSQGPKTEANDREWLFRVRGRFGTKPKQGGSISADPGSEKPKDDRGDRVLDQRRVSDGGCESTANHAESNARHQHHVESQPRCVSWPLRNSGEVLSPSSRPARVCRGS